MMLQKKLLALATTALCAAGLALPASAAPLKIGMSFQELNNPYFITMKKRWKTRPPASAPPSSSPTRATTWPSRPATWKT